MESIILSHPSLYLLNIDIDLEVAFSAIDRLVIDCLHLNSIIRARLQAQSSLSRAFLDRFHKLNKSRLGCNRVIHDYANNNKDVGTVQWHSHLEVVEAAIEEDSVVEEEGLLEVAEAGEVCD